ncbi:type II toxin-antitoxin system VapC family toxin [soil metagenome]
MLFCDTSALIKLYLHEPHSKALRDLAAGADAVAVCRIAWAEAHAAMAHRERLVRADAGVIRQARRALARDWQSYLILEVTQALVELAGDHAETFALRGYDSVQLAAAHRLAEQTQLPTLFACFDDRLNKAARILGLQAPFGDILD